MLRCVQTDQEAHMAVDTLTRDIGRQLTRRGFTGELVEPGHGTAYEQARHVWSGSIDRRPAGIARCHDGDDVAAAVTASIELGVPLAGPGGGHSVAGPPALGGRHRGR